MKDLDTKEMDSEEQELYKMLRSKFNQEEMLKLAKLMVIDAEKYHQEKLNNNIDLGDVSYCAEQTKNLLTNKFCEIAKKHVGETFDKVPDATDILKAIDVIEKHCS